MNKGALRPVSLLRWRKGINVKGGAAEGARIYYFHGVVEKRRDLFLERNFHTVAEFRALLDAVKDLRVVPLSDVAAAIQDGCTKELQKAVVITFDDGFANNLMAGELLNERGLPWSLFVTTAELGPNGLMWLIELALLLLAGEAKNVTVLKRRWCLTSRRRRRHAYSEIRRALKQSDARSVQEAMDELRGGFPLGESQRLSAAFPAFRMMRWEDVGRLAENGVEIGSHGVNHVLHNSRQPAEIREHELRGSKETIERQLNRGCRFFAYPNGDHCPESDAAAAKAGYELCLTTLNGVVGIDFKGRLLPRIEAAKELDGFKMSLPS